MNRFIAMVTALLLCTASAAWAPYTSTIPQQCPDVCQPCPDCSCPPAPDCNCGGTRQECPALPCPEAPDCICPECPSLTCPDPCPVIDDDDSHAGVYTIIGIGGATGWSTAEVTLGTFTIYGNGDVGWGYQCIIAGGVDRHGCQTYLLKRRKYE